MLREKQCQTKPVVIIEYANDPEPDVYGSLPKDGFVIKKTDLTPRIQAETNTEDSVNYFTVNRLRSTDNIIHDTYNNHQRKPVYFYKHQDAIESMLLNSNASGSLRQEILPSTAQQNMPIYIKSIGRAKRNQPTNHAHSVERQTPVNPTGPGIIYRAL